jgi:hypothetical protein
MTFTLKDTETSQFVKNHKDENGIHVENNKFLGRIDPFSFERISRYGVSNKKELQKATPKTKDTLHTFNVKSFKAHNLLFINEINGESFEIQMHTADVNVDQTIEKYYHYQDFTSKKTTVYNYRSTTHADSQMGIAIVDLMKYHYFMNKDDPDLGFGDEINKPIKAQLISFVKKCVISANATLETIPFGIVTRHILSPIVMMFCIDKHQPNWDFDNFISHFILVDYKSIHNIKVAKNIAYLYVTGDNYTNINYVDIIHFEEPKFIIDCINDHENTKDHQTIYVRNRISKKLKKSQLELLDKYPEYVLPKGTLSNGKIERDGSYCNWYHDIPKVMSYPLFAFRNIMTYDWIPGKTLKLISDIVEWNEEIQKRNSYKHNSKKLGKPIYFQGDTGNIYKMPGRWGNCVRKFERVATQKVLNKLERDQQYDIYEQLNDS